VSEITRSDLLESSQVREVEHHGKEDDGKKAGTSMLTLSVTYDMLNLRSETIKSAVQATGVTYNAI